MVAITMIEVSLRFGLSEELARETPYADAFKVCVHLPALCPQQPCSAENVIQVSSAENKNDQSLTFRCTHHNCEFTLANSLFGKRLITYLFKHLFDIYVDGNATLQQLSTEIRRDPAQLTRYVDELAGEISARLPQAPAPRVTPPAAAPNSNASASESAHFDVTFSKNSHHATKICLPTRNDGQTAPPVFLRRLNADSFAHTLRTYADTFGFPTLVVSDGETALAAALEQLCLPSMLLQHIHLPPYDRVTAVFWAPPQPCGCRLRITLGLPSAFPKTAGRYEGKLAFKIEPCKAHKCLCLPEYCLRDDHHPLCKVCQQNAAGEQLHHRVRGLWLHKVWSSPLSFQFEAYGGRRAPTVPVVQWQALPAPWSQIGRYWVVGLLVGIWRSFREQSITNNRSETANWQLKAFMRWQGRPSEDDGHIIRKVLVWWAKKFRPQWWERILRRWVFKKRWRQSLLLHLLCPFGSLVDKKITVIVNHG